MANTTTTGKVADRAVKPSAQEPVEADAAAARSLADRVAELDSKIKKFETDLATYKPDTAAERSRADRVAELDSKVKKFETDLANYKAEVKTLINDGVEKNQKMIAKAIQDAFAKQANPPK